MASGRGSPMAWAIRPAVLALHGYEQAVQIFGRLLAGLGAGKQRHEAGMEIAERALSLIQFFQGHELPPKTAPFQDITFDSRSLRKGGCKY